MSADVIKFPPPNRLHEVGTVSLDDGPDRVKVDCVFLHNSGPDAGLVDVAIFPHASAIDFFNPSQFDAESGEILPECWWWMSPEKALAVAALLREAAQRCQAEEQR